MGDNDLHNFDAIYDWYDKQTANSKAPSHVKLHKEERKWNIEHVEPYGRCTVAARDIKEGEILNVDQPLITGPRQDSGVMCLGCYNQLPSWDGYHCSKCGWPLCGPNCEGMGYHPMECKLLAAAGYKPRLEDFPDAQYMYESCMPLRCYCLKDLEPDKWKALMSLQDHNEERRGTPLWKREQTNVVDFLRNKVKVNIEEDLLHTIIGILDVNCHEVRTNVLGPDSQDEHRVRGVYPLCAMMSHLCSSNTHHMFKEDMTMMVVASRPVKKGEQITATYTHLLSATTERRKHLQFGKFFDCVCDRCKDPTEMGTYFGALRCSRSRCNGNVLCTDPICPTNDAPWKCNKCPYQIPSETVERLNKLVYAELRLVSENDPAEFEAIFKKYKLIFHPQHFHLIGIKHSLSQLYGRVSGYMMTELSEASMLRKIECCQDLLKVLDIIDPGISRLRGLTLYELHAPLMVQANIAFQNTGMTRKGFLSKMQEAADYLSRAIYCLNYEPVSSPEGEICKISRNALQELQGSIKIAKGLPDSYFLPDQ